MEESVGKKIYGVLLTTYLEKKKDQLLKPQSFSKFSEPFIRR